MPEYRVCGRKWCFGEQKKGEFCALWQDGVLTAFAPDGSEIPVPPDAVVCAGKYLWEEREICELPIFVTVDGDRRMAMVTVTGNKVTQVTADAGYAVFSPQLIPLSCTHPLINDPVPAGDGNLRLTAFRTDRPYAAVFLETAGDCALIGKLPRWETVLPEETVFLYIFAADEKKLYVRTGDGRGSSVSAEHLCAAAAAGVAAGYCRPDTSIVLPFADGEARVICRRDRSLIATFPVITA